MASEMVRIDGMGPRVNGLADAAVFHIRWSDFGCGGRDGRGCPAAKHHLHPRRRLGAGRPGLLWRQEDSDAEHRSTGGRGDAVYAVLCGVAGVLAVAVRARSLGSFPARWRITSYLAEKKRNLGAEMADFLDPKAPSLPRALHEAGYRTAHFGKWHLGGGRDVTDAPKFAAYGYDEHAGTYESPEPDPDITATDWIWSDKDKVKRWKRTAVFRR